MEIQNISGPDVVPQGFSVQSAPESESGRRAEEIRVERRPQEENKGNNIDHYA